MPEAKANPTHVPAKGREDDDDTDEEGWVLVRALRKALGLTGQPDPKEAGTWILLRVAVLLLGIHVLFAWTHMLWGWGPCRHRTHLEILREFKPELMAPQPAPAPGQRPPIIAPGRGP